MQGTAVWRAAHRVYLGLHFADITARQRVILQLLNVAHFKVQLAITSVVSLHLLNGVLEPALLRVLELFQFQLVLHVMDSQSLIFTRDYRRAVLGGLEEFGQALFRIQWHFSIIETGSCLAIRIDLIVNHALLLGNAPLDLIEVILVLIFFIRRALLCIAFLVIFLL